ncbi:hypothetical protein BLL41_18170 [Bacillus sp. FMQ74]|uniref:hypothetical protein n=1 Tax=Bacillus sp. FMQ74 TaxID=1913579 RepID=UPI0008FB23E0|nr:hypothetical protein [Bacillus sp. FMQ74]OIR59775.1 hypothetical protein BLL41_18170 [Bacillus sp. FMQ74]
MKNKLQQIKENIKFAAETEGNEYRIIKEDLDWLIQQAEKVETQSSFLGQRNNSEVDVIECPHCQHLMGYDDYIEVGDMSGEFKMDCEKCQKPFDVDFCSMFYFTTEKPKEEK